MVTTTKEAVKEKVLYQLHAPQQQAMQLLGLDHRVFQVKKEDVVNELLYGGQAGGGKSHLLRAALVTICFIWPGATVALFRRTYPELEDTHIKKLKEELPESIAKYHERTHTFNFFNRSKLVCRHCERENDVYRYQSAEWQALGIDEATHFSQFQLEYLGTRVRAETAKFPNWRRIILYTANPGNIGHTYFKTEFVTKAESGVPFQHEVWDPIDKTTRIINRCFLRARLDDNPSLDPAEYRAALGVVSDETIRKALLEGDWDVYAGQYFTQWRYDRHVIEPFEIPKNWTRWVAIDYGFAVPFCALWFARPPDNSKVYVYRELYGEGIYDHEQARLIRQLSRGERIKLFVADGQMFNERREVMKDAISKVYERNGIRLVRATKTRLSGWAKVRRDMHWTPEKGPRLQVFNTCKNLIRTIPEMTFSKLNPEDLADKLDNKKTEDHAVDALRYGLMAEAPSKHRTLNNSMKGKIR